MKGGWTSTCLIHPVFVLLGATVLFSSWPLVVWYCLYREQSVNAPEVNIKNTMNVGQRSTPITDLQILINRCVRVCVLSSADPEAQTFLDQQTPLHYAAKNGAVGSIRLLLQAAASISCTDCKQRTPLQLAANMGTDMITEATTDIMTDINTDTMAESQPRLLTQQEHY